jgi:polysaccharide biosynthesis protein PslG
LFAVFVVTAATTRLSGPDEPAAAEPAPTSTRITAWPAELDEATVGVKVDAWPEAQAPLDIQVQPGQTVRLDAEPPAGGLEAGGRRWRFTGWLIQDTGFDAGRVPSPDPADATVATFTASPAGPPAAARMVFEPMDGPANGPVYAAMGEAPAGAQAQLPPPIVPGADAKGFAVGADIVPDGQLDLMKGMGASWVRFDLSWQRIQPTMYGGYHFDEYDRYIGAMGARGLVPLPILVDAPEWAMKAGGTLAPEHYGAFANFAAATVQHYPNIRIWEIWNEPNHPAFWPGPSGRDYAAMLHTVSAAIHGIDPAAIVIGGALAAVPDAGGVIDPAAFLRDMYRNGARASMNAVSVHPYCYWQAARGSCPGNAPGWAAAFAASNSVRRVMDDNGDGGKALWVTEMGAASSGGPGGYGAVDPVAFTEEQQAEHVRAAYSAFRDVRGPKGPMFWYRPADTCDDPGHNECFFGLLRTDGSEKPAAGAYRAVSPTAPAASTPPAQASADPGQAGTSEGFQATPVPAPGPAPEPPPPEPESVVPAPAPPAADPAEPPVPPPLAPAPALAPAPKAAPPVIPRPHATPAVPEARTAAAVRGTERGQQAVAVVDGLLSSFLRAFA